MSYYKSRYKKSTIRDKWHFILIKGLKFIAKTRLRNLLSFLDCYNIDNIDKTRDFNNRFLDHSTIEIQLRNIEFLDVVEIDNIHLVEKQVYKIIKRHKFYTLFGKGKKLPASEVSEIKSNLDKFKQAYRTASKGKLFELINEEPTDKNDLYEYINFSYFKTFENLFILRLNVKPSKIFLNYFEYIKANKEIPTDKPIIFHFKDFLRTRRIFAGYRTAGNQKHIAFNELIHDLNFQLKESFFLGFKGIFSSKNMTNPYVSYFNIKEKLNYKELKKGFGIIETRNLSNMYYDQKNGYYLQNNWNTDNNKRNLNVIAENDMFPDDYDNEKTLAKYCLSNTLYRSWGILNYIQVNNSGLSLFRSTIYNFINLKGTPKFRKQIRIKKELSSQKIKIKRIQKEFTDRNLHWYLTDTDYDIRQFCFANLGWSKELNYYDFAKSNIEYFIKDNNSQIDDLDDYFNEISSINLVKLNYRFQLIAIGLTILGLLLAIASADDIIKLIQKLIEIITVANI